MTNDINRFENIDAADDQHDELDALLRRWHDVNAQRTRAGREALMQRLRSQQRAGLSQPGPGAKDAPEIAVARQGAGVTHAGSRSALHAQLRRIASSRYFRAAASLALVITLIALLIPVSHSPALAQEIMAPDGGRLEAHDEHGNLIGPCALKHTDVNVQISGPFTRVTLKQQYHNPYKSKIEAVYTFPLSHRSAVDRMTMTIGDRVVEAEVKERQQARQIYESARQAGYVASLLEQERPNIFTQSVANIEPNAEVLIEISYVEMLESKDGEFSFDFPMVVAPRYMPGYASAQVARLPAELTARYGVILRAPAQLNGVHAQAQNLTEGVRLGLEFLPGNPGIVRFPQGVQSTPYPTDVLERILKSAQPIEYPGALWWGNDQAKWPQISIGFVASYSDGMQEIGVINADGTGQVNNRWFFCEPHKIEAMGTGYEPNTDQVPDASRISPMPVRPPTRAGHDISMTVSIDTGGPAIVDWKSDLHEIICTDGPRYRDLGNKVNLALKDQKEIPNRDFVLRWKVLDDVIQESIFVYLDGKKSGTGVSHVRRPEDHKSGTGETPVPPQDVPSGDGFITLVIAPPTRIAPEIIPPRELIFVLDTSGSMSGQPIEAAKSVMAKAIETMRPGDTFNVITFSGDTHILWDKPQPNTENNRAAAQAFLVSRAGSGGTEMMKAIDAALAPTPVAADAALNGEQLANLPADGREVVLRAKMDDIEAIVMKNAIMEPKLRVRDNLTIPLTPFQTRLDLMGSNPELDLRGRWETRNGERLFAIMEVKESNSPRGNPLRIVMFLTDGLVGNDDCIICAVKEHAKKPGGPRVFSFGVGNSPNRYLLEGMANAGRGEVEYVNLETDPAPIVERFVKRIETPVLTDIRVALEGEGLTIDEAVPPLDRIPDVFDRQPIVIHGRIKLPLPLGEGPPIRGEGKAKLRVTGNTGAGPYERTIELAMPEKTDQHSMLPALWARAKVGELEASDLQAIANGNVTPDIHKQIVGLGEQFNIMTRFTSFVAVEKSRLTVAGRPVLVPIPVVYPDGMVWEGVFGPDGECGIAHERVQALSARLQFDQQFEQSKASLARGDYEAAARELLTAKVQLEQRKQFVGTEDFDQWKNEADELLASVEQLRVHSVASSDLVARAAEQSMQTEAERAHAQRTQQVTEALGRVRQLQQELKYKEALQIVDEILFIDENNPSALALRDVITTTQVYRDYASTGQIKELGVANLSIEQQPSMIPPRQNVTKEGKDAEATADGAPQSGTIEFAWNRGRIAEDAQINGVVDVNDLLKVVNNWAGPGGGPIAPPPPPSTPTAGKPIAMDPSANVARNPFILPDDASVNKGGAVYGLPPSTPTDDKPIAGYPNTYHLEASEWRIVTDINESAVNGNVPTGYITVGQTTGPMLGDIPVVGQAGLININSAPPTVVDHITQWRHLTNISGAPELDLDDALNQGGGGGGFGGGGGGGAGQRGEPIFVQLKHADAAKVAAELNVLLGESGMGSSLDSPSEGLTGEGFAATTPQASPATVRVVPIRRQNGIVIEAPPEYAEAIQNLSQQLDQPAARSKAGLEAYPEDWPHTSFRRGGDNAARDSAQSRAVFQKLLETRVPIDFNNTLEQIVNYFDAVTGLTIKPDWESLATIGVARESLVTLKRSDVSAAEGLELVLSQLGSEGKRPWFDVVDGTVVIGASPESTKPQAAAGEQLGVSYKDAETLRREIESREAERAAAIAELQRIGRLRKVIDRRLWPKVSLEAQDDAALTPALSQEEREVAVAVLVRDVEKATLDSIKAAGLRVDDVAERVSVVGGAIAANRLDDLALVESVRRIEAVTVE